MEPTVRLNASARGVAAGAGAETADGPDNRGERELRLREREVALLGQMRRKFDGLLAALVAVAACLVPIALLLGLSFWQGRDEARRARTLAEAGQRLQQQRFEWELASAALSADTEEERGRNLEFLVRAGLLPARTAERLQTLAREDPAGLPRFARTGATLPGNSSGGAQQAAATVPTLPSPVRVEERPARPEPAAALPRRRQSAPPPGNNPAPVAQTERSSDEENTGTRRSRRETIRRAQRVLDARGYYPGPVDGPYDTNTKEAVARFQREHGLSDDGLLGPKTLRAIERAAGTRPRNE